MDIRLTDMYPLLQGCHLFFLVSSCKLIWTWPSRPSAPHAPCSMADRQRYSFEGAHARQSVKIGLWPRARFWNGKRSQFCNGKPTRTPRHLGGHPPCGWKVVAGSGGSAPRFAFRVAGFVCQPSFPEFQNWIWVRFCVAFGTCPGGQKISETWSPEPTRQYRNDGARPILGPDSRTKKKLTSRPENVPKYGPCARYAFQKS